MKTLVYILGILALGHTDFNASSTFQSQILPLIDLCFVIFIVLDLWAYLAVVGLGPQGYNLYDMLRDIFDLNHDIRAIGFIPAVSELFFTVLEFVLLITAIVFVLSTLLTVATQ